jgi:membrane protein YdbS with pleckstrin-like domain
MDKLHPGAKWMFRIQTYFGLIILLIFIAFPIHVKFALSGYSSFIIYLVPILLIYIVIAEIFIHWAYNNWQYELTQDSLKIEKGVIIKKYKSIPYERVQNVDITRGIIARIFGFSTIDIQTAGYSAYAAKGGVGQSEGHLPALSIDQAERIRDFLMKKITGKKQGL